MRNLDVVLLAVAWQMGCTSPAPARCLTNADCTAGVCIAGRCDAAPDAGSSSHADAARSDGGLPSDAPSMADAGSDAASDGCSAARPADCAYLPASPLAEMPVRITTLSYTDITGATRSFEVGVHRPIGATEPLPIVVWSHGGADGIDHADHVGEEWARIFTSAGYAVVAIAHPTRDAASRSALCAALGYDTVGCTTFKYLNWDRPHDFAVVLDWVEAQARGPLRGVIEPSELVYAGHSAGAGSAMMIAGASRDYAGTLTTLSDPRPIAFIACSPQGPGEEGFADTSFDAISRPVLSLTGAGDDVTGSVAENRIQPFLRMRPGEKYVGFITEESAQHGTFDQDADGCRRYQAMLGADLARCDAYGLWLASAALAFLDAEVRHDAAAHDYLSSEALSILSGGAMDWRTR